MLKHIRRLHLVLHPGLKLGYFQQCNWPNSWVKTAADMVETVFKNYQAKYSKVANATTPSPAVGGPVLPYLICFVALTLCYIM